MDWGLVRNARRNIDLLHVFGTSHGCNSFIMRFVGEDRGQKGCLALGG